MRVRTVEPRDSIPPFNSVYAGFTSDFYTKLFEGRRKIESFDQEYVSNQEAEREVVGFAKSGTTDIGVFVGPPGIGKTTLIQFLCDKIWGSQPCIVLYNDCSEQVMDMGPHVFEVTDLRENEASRVANQILKSLLKKHAFELRATLGAVVTGENGRMSPSDWEEFFRFVARVSDTSDITLPDAWSLPIPDINQAALEFIAREEGMQFAKLLFFHAVCKSGISHVKIVLDNLDDKNYAIIEALIENTAHAVKFMSNLRLKPSPGETVKKVIFSVIVACRPATALILKNNNDRPGHGWFKTKEITMARSASLANILTKRYKVLTENMIDNPVKVSAGAVLWEFPSRTAFFVSLCNSLEESGQAEEFVELANRNLADSVAYVGDVLRNRHFVDVGKLVSEYFGRTGEPAIPSVEAYAHVGRTAINRTTVVRSLAYGNQGNIDEPLYPVRGTPIPNMLESKPHSLFRESVAKPRLIQRLIRRMVDGGTGAVDATTCRIVKEELRYWFGRTDLEATAIVDELHLEGLLENMDAERRPSVTGNNCRVRATPRASRLWNHLATDSVLLQCYRDDCCLRSDLDKHTQERPTSWILKPTYDLNFHSQLHQSYLMCLQCYVVEKEQLTASIRTVEDFEQFIAVYSVELVTSRLINGVRNSWERFFSFHLKHESSAKYSPIESLSIEATDWWNQFCLQFRRKSGGII